MGAAEQAAAGTARVYVAQFALTRMLSYLRVSSARRCQVGLNICPHVPACPRLKQPSDGGRKGGTGWTNSAARR